MRAKIRYKRESLYPRRIRTEMELFVASKFTFNREFGLSGLLGYSVTSFQTI